MKEHKLAAIVFTDIVGYTSRMAKDEQHTMNLLMRQREIIFPLVKEFNGDVIKEIGDGLMMMFNSAVKAVRFAIAVQNRLDDEELTIRAGIHIGDVIFEKGDVFGSAVNIAARIEPLAPSGGICISEDVYSQIKNKDDIFSVSVGKKHLKGVDAPIEIYRVISQEDASETKVAVPFLKDLWQRRVFQITFIYLITAWLLKFAMSAIVTQFFLSPYLVDLTWIILLSLIPSVILVSYFHGRRGVSRWKRVELIGMPLNIVVSALIIVFVFKGKDLGATTTSLTVENEDGELVERVVIKNEFRKRLAIFNFENQTNDTALNYLQHILPFMTSYDISQDLFISSISANDIYTRLNDAGFPDGMGLPLNLMKNIAEGLHMNYFLTGEFYHKNNEYILNAKLYETRYTKLISAYTITKPDIFSLIDELSLKIKEGMDMPENHVIETTDLPIAEIFTNSNDAVKYYTKAILASRTNNWYQAINHLQHAIEDDPDFALAYINLTLYCFNVSQMENASHAIEKAMENLIKLPERQQFIAKFLYYLFRQEAVKALAVVEMWVELYPDDLLGRQTLAERYFFNNMKNEAIEEYKAVLRLDPEQYDILNNIADTYLQMGEYDSALYYYKSYARQFPQQFEIFVKIGNFYRITNDVTNARKNYEKALLLAPISEKASILIDLADVERMAGEFDKALEQYNEALAACNNARDSVSVYGSLQTFYELKGQFGKTLEYYKKKLPAMQSYLSPKDLLVYQVFTIDVYVKANMTVEAFEVLEEIKSQLEPPLDNVIPIGEMFIYAELGDVEKAEKAMVGVEELARGFGQESIIDNVYYSKGKVYEAKGDYEKAIENYDIFIKNQPNSFSTHRHIAKCYRKLGNYEKAEEQLIVSLENRPFNPINNYEAALLYLETGEDEKALEYLKRAVEIWKDADEDYELAKEAKERYEELTSGN